VESLSSTLAAVFSDAHAMVAVAAVATVEACAWAFERWLLLAPG
jgi:hypothetical protein